MCGIGKAIATVECQKVAIMNKKSGKHCGILKVSGPTSAPLTTAKPCVDKYSNCAELAKTNCKAHGESCAKVVTSQGEQGYFLTSFLHQSCGLCDGMTPHISNTCADSYNNCASLATNYCYRFGSSCCMSCGLGESGTSVGSEGKYSL